MTNELLDAADSIASDGLVDAGYRLLAVDACPALMHPSNRASIASYAFSRGLTLIFAGLSTEALRPRAMEHAIFPHSSDESGCTARALAEASGASGWNDPRALMDASAKTDEGSVRPQPLPHRLRALRVRFAHACMHRRPLALSPSVRPRSGRAGTGGAGDLGMDIERTLVLATLTNRVALVLHAAPLNETSLATAQRHPVRINAGDSNVQAWVRHLASPAAVAAPPSGLRGRWGRLVGGARARRAADAAANGDDAGALRSVAVAGYASASSSVQGPPLAGEEEGVFGWRAPVSALLLINKGHDLATARLPVDATWPFSHRQLFVHSAWGNTSAASATGVPAGTPLTAIMGSIDIPPYDAVLYLLFASQLAAQQFELSGTRARGGSEAGVADGGRARGRVGSSRIGSDDRGWHRGAAAIDAGRRSGPRGDRRHERSGGDGQGEWLFWSQSTWTSVAVWVAASTATIGACVLLRRLGQRREDAATRWDRYANSRLLESPNERPGTESKRKGRGRSNRPRLPSAWVPMAPATPVPLHAGSPCSPNSDDCYRHDTTPVPFKDLLDMADDAACLGTRRGFACSQSFQELSPYASPMKHAVQAHGPPLIGGGASSLIPRTHTAGSEEENAPHRRTPRKDKSCCFNV